MSFPEQSAAIDASRQTTFLATRNLRLLVTTALFLIRWSSPSYLPCDADRDGKSLRVRAFIIGDPMEAMKGGWRRVMTLIYVRDWIGKDA